MKIMITGANGSIGRAAARALRHNGHKVFCLAGSLDERSHFEEQGFDAVDGDFTDPASLGRAVRGFDAVVSAASILPSSHDAERLSRERAAVHAMLAAMEGSGRTFLLASDSAVFGVFSGGVATRTVYQETDRLPLRRETYAPASSVHPTIAQTFGSAVNIRVETEEDVLGARGVRGIVVRPGLIYGYAASYELPYLIAVARQRGAVPQFGHGGARQGYVHIDDLGTLFASAVTNAPGGALLHGVTDDVSMSEIARAVAELLGIGVDQLTLEEMVETLGSVGISLSLNKRVASDATRQLTGWRPGRKDLLRDIVNGSYAPRLVPTLDRRDFRIRD